MNKTIPLVYLFEPGFSIKIVHVDKENVKIWQQDMVSYDHERKEVWLNWFYLGEL